MFHKVVKDKHNKRLFFKRMTSVLESGHTGILRGDEN